VRARGVGHAYASRTADPNYDAWELEGLGRLMVVCTPGGGEPSIFNE